MSETLEDSEVLLNEMEGEDYKVVLKRLHDLLRPKSYLEIGSRDGSSLELASCGSIAIDPEFKLDKRFLGPKPFCCLYRMGSDEFFSTFDPKIVLGRKIDFAFLDGLHLAEFLLRDFINVERHSRSNSVVAIHDCAPLDVAMARRHEQTPIENRSARRPGWWTGDVWKVLLILQEYRPELQVVLLNARPTGLALVTGLDPTSNVLSDAYFEILKKLRALSNAHLTSFIKSVSLVKTSEMLSYEDVSQYFWL